MEQKFTKKEMLEIVIHRSLQEDYDTFKKNADHEWLEVINDLERYHFLRHKIDEMEQKIKEINEKYYGE